MLNSFQHLNYGKISFEIPKQVRDDREGQMSSYEKLLKRVRELLENISKPCQVSVFWWAFTSAAHEQFLPESSYKPFFRDMLKQFQKEGIITAEKRRRETKKKLKRKEAWGHQSWLLKYDNN